MKLVSSLFKQDPLLRELRKTEISTDNLKVECVGRGVQLWEERREGEQEEALLRALIRLLEEKGGHARKAKVMMVLVEVSKRSKYDICDIILGKKMKVFTRAGRAKGGAEPRGEQLEAFICEQLLVPLYNYLMKVSTNEELYHTCQGGSIPHDDIFRRGTKIRFIWIFKVYNLMSLLVPILQALLRAHHLNPALAFFAECARLLFNDLATMNNFVTKALDEASHDNFMLMPYFDMLQFHESLREQTKVGGEIRQLHKALLHFAAPLVDPLPLALSPEDIQEIEIQALRVKLISNSLKNPKKDHGYLETEYQEKLEQREKTLENHQTEPVGREAWADFKERYRNLD